MHVVSDVAKKIKQDMHLYANLAIKIIMDDFIPKKHTILSILKIQKSK